MGLFDFFKKKTTPVQAQTIEPYADSSTNHIYNLLFCDDLDLYRQKTQEPYTFPFDVLFSEPVDQQGLQKMVDDRSLESRLKILAYNRQLASGHSPVPKELLAVIVEVGLANGLDVLASFRDGTARYINYTGKILVWETREDASANKITEELFARSQPIVNVTGPWHKPRLPHPSKGVARISFLVSDGLYFGEAPVNTLFDDSLAGPALAKATELMQYLTEKS